MMKGSLVFPDGSIAPVENIALRDQKVIVEARLTGAAARRALPGMMLRLHGEDGSLITTIEVGNADLSGVRDRDSILWSQPLGFLNQHCIRADTEETR